MLAEPVGPQTRLECDRRLRLYANMQQTAQVVMGPNVRNSANNAASPQKRHKTSLEKLKTVSNFEKL